MTCSFQQGLARYHVNCTHLYTYNSKQQLRNGIIWGR